MVGKVLYSSTSVIMYSSSRDDREGNLQGWRDGPGTPQMGEERWDGWRIERLLACLLLLPTLGVCVRACAAAAAALLSRMVGAGSSIMSDGRWQDRFGGLKGGDGCPTYPRIGGCR